MEKPEFAAGHFKEIERLIALLEQEKETYSAVLALTRRQKDVIVKNDAAQLDGLGKEQMELVHRAQTQGEERERVSGILCRALGFETLNISLLAQHARPSQKSALLRLQKELEEIIAGLRAASDINQRLMRDQLDYIDFMLTTITQGERVAHDYNVDGTAKEWQGGHASLFDHKV